MVIEAEVIKYLNDDSTLSSTYGERPETLSGSFYVVEKLGHQRKNMVDTARIAVQSYGDSMEQVAEMDQAIRTKMFDMPQFANVYGVHLENSYNFTDTSQKKYRYQSVFKISY